MQVTDVFPRRPLQIATLRPRPPLRKALVLFLIGAGFVGLCRDVIIRGLADDYRLNKSGVIARQSNVRYVSCWAIDGVLFPNCTLTGTYQSADGMDHEKTWHYFNLVSTLPHSEFSVRYDPDAPSRAATSWGSDLLAERTFFLVLFSFPPVFLFIYIPVRLWIESIRLGRKVGAIGRDPMPMAVRMVGIVDPFYMFWGHLVEFRWTDPATGHMFFDETLFGGASQPFCLDPAHTTMLALAQNGRAHLLDAALRTVALTDSERLSVFEAQKRSLNPVAPA